MPSKLIIISILLCYFLPWDIANCQFSSVDNHAGYWTDTNSWSNYDYPGLSIKKTNISCFGYLTSEHCININLGTLSLHDTLVISGNFQLSNKAVLQVDPGAVLFIFGDLDMNNQAEVYNKGLIVVAGNFSILGSPNLGTFSTDSGKFYLFDNSPYFPTGGNYSDLTCDDTSHTDDTCGYGNLDDFQQDAYYNFYASLPYATKKLNHTGNECYKATITSLHNTLCLNDTNEYFLNITGINTNDSIVWNFGRDAVPQKAYGVGPHLVYYVHDGFKSVEIDIISDTTLQITQSNIVSVQNYPVTGQLVNSSDTETQTGPYFDQACRNSIRTYSVSGQVNSIYQWRIPELSIDTITNNITANWDVPDGVYNISATEISSNGCRGSISKGLVLVKECVETNLQKKTNFAFSPNGDGINDCWVIEGIEKYPEAKITVFNKNGKIVYKSNGDYQNDWDGTCNGQRLPMASYYFIIDLQKYKLGIIKGMVTILPVELR